MQLRWSCGVAVVFVSILPSERMVWPGLFFCVIFKWWSGSNFFSKKERKGNQITLNRLACGEALTGAKCTRQPRISTLMILAAVTAAEEGRSP